MHTKLCLLALFILPTSAVFRDRPATFDEIDPFVQCIANLPIPYNYTITRFGGLEIMPGIYGLDDTSLNSDLNRCIWKLSCISMGFSCPRANSRLATRSHLITMVSGHDMIRDGLRAQNDEPPYEMGISYEVWQRDDSESESSNSSVYSDSDGTVNSDTAPWNQLYPVNPAYWSYN
ncbi:unnamed protein product [Kuraishia capsulata CBS 1993]|uniref:Uncharacterized protein n=1 Tax=Kuraishia capsulata CBS 1993 TaxID=1382522 RepID=W6MWF1_9ASCO|nr:uncharacterized protein KUCA_T00003313001 [Kuraishia capsulata CBS 1993]CDK27335.1 unnamed protein product [Kuraishia capsulata CBS 1993]